MAQVRTTPRGADAREARIGGTTRVRGRIHGEGDLVVEGHVEGDVAIRGNLTLAEGGRIASEVVEAHSVTIAGTLDGNVAASGPVRLVPGARVHGDVRGTAVTIDDGARYSGRLDCEFDLPPELGGTSRTDTRARTPARR